MARIAALEQLVHELSKLPGIGEKTATRLAYFVLNNKQSFGPQLRRALKEVEDKIRNCTECNTFTDQEICEICASPLRDEKTLCIVEQADDVFKIEAAGMFKGKYHVLGGVLSPMQGIQPEDLSITPLLQRIEDKGVTEVILALDADLEGDTTALYIAKQLEGKNIKLTRLAQGIPIGSDLDFMDHRTLGRALENRVEL